MTERIYVEAIIYNRVLEFRLLLYTYKSIFKKATLILLEKKRSVASVSVIGRATEETATKKKIKKTKIIEEYNT